MQPIPFIAASAEEAVAQIRARLGPDAVVLNVRPLPANGIARLWQKPMIEVLAHLPEAPAPQAAPISEALAEFRQQLNEIKQQVATRPQHTERRAPAQREPGQPLHAEQELCAPALADSLQDDFSIPEAEQGNGNWRVGTMLQKSGLLPLHVQSIMDRLRSQHGDEAPAALSDEIKLARALLAKLWRKPRPLAPHSVHALIGPAGSGKTTCLCKWLTRAALVEGSSARVWRLDGAMANTAESLSVYCEILGLPSERSWQPGHANITEDIGFIDLPGVDWRQPVALKELSGQLKQYGSPRLHLVLNGAYDTSILLAQVRAFSALPIDDLIITHLDEESRWGKVWNFALGTNYSLRHFGTGQNIPGDFCEPSAEMVLARQFPCK